VNLRPIVLGGLGPTELTGPEREALEKQLGRTSVQVGACGSVPEDVVLAESLHTRQACARQRAGALLPRWKETARTDQPPDAASTSSFGARLLPARDASDAPVRAPQGRRSASFELRQRRPFSLPRRRSASLSTAFLRRRTHVQPSTAEAKAMLQPLVLQLPVERPAPSTDKAEAEASVGGGEYQPPTPPPASVAPLALQSALEQGSAPVLEDP